MKANNWNFSHANGTVKPHKVREARVPEADAGRDDRPRQADRSSEDWNARADPSRRLLERRSKPARRPATTLGEGTATRWYGDVTTCAVIVSRAGHASR